MIKIFRNLRITKFIKYVCQELENQKLGRQQVGVDRDGNKYYQYYSYYGLPTRREIRFKENGDWELRDLVYYRWLYNFDYDAPTEQQKQQFYLQEKLRYQRALEWDQKQANLMIEFRKKRQELLHRNKAMMELQKQLEAKTQLEIQSKRKQ